MFRWVVRKQMFNEEAAFISEAWKTVDEKVVETKEEDPVSAAEQAFPEYFKEWNWCCLKAQSQPKWTFSNKTGRESLKATCEGRVN